MFDKKQDYKSPTVLYISTSSQSAPEKSPVFNLFFKIKKILKRKVFVNHSISF